MKNCQKNDIHFESNMITYIHYGSGQFDPDLFQPVRNSTWQSKPEGGLWGSRADDAFGWESWCRKNRFNPEHLKMSFRFTLPEAKILILENPDQLLILPTLQPWKPKEPPKVELGGMPTMEQLREWFSPNWCYLDYEKLAEEYDAVELKNAAAFREPLPTWDCNSVVVLRAEAVREV